MSAPTATDMNLFQWQARLARRATSFLVHTLSTTDHSKVGWTPSVNENSKCRSILDQMNECIRINQGSAARLVGKEPDVSEPAGNIGEAIDQLKDSGEALAKAIETLSPDALHKTHATPMGEMPGFLLMELPVNNMLYHFGQICQIEMLCGNDEFRIPPNVMEF